ncbi:hypothetical protein GCM10009128_10090 [Psychrosphaera haliotis]
MLPLSNVNRIDLSAIFEGSLALPANEAKEAKEEKESCDKQIIAMLKRAFMLF